MSRSSGIDARVTDMDRSEAGDSTAVLRDLVEGRWSCRSFDRKQVPRSDIEDILQIARRTPSWCNTQPWHVHITEGFATEQLRQAIAERISQQLTQEPDIDFPVECEGVYQDRRRESGWQLYESLGIAKGDRVASGKQMLKNFDFFGAPHVAMITTEKNLGPYGAVDCGLFVSNFLLAAHSMGIATVPQAALAAQAPTIREFFDIPAERQVLLGISFGYPDLGDPVNSYRTGRQSTAEVATFIR
ncbi:nitroreductase [Gordonia rubripertincta]